MQDFAAEPFLDEEELTDFEKAWQDMVGANYIQEVPYPEYDTSDGSDYCPGCGLRQDCINPMHAVWLGGHWVWVFCSEKCCEEWFNTQEISVTYPDGSKIPYPGQVRVRRCVEVEINGTWVVVERNNDEEEKPEFKLDIEEATPVADLKEGPPVFWEKETEPPTVVGRIIKEGQERRTQDPKILGTIQGTEIKKAYRPEGTGFGNAKVTGVYPEDRRPE